MRAGGRDGAPDDGPEHDVRPELADHVLGEGGVQVAEDEADAEEDDDEAEELPEARVGAHLARDLQRVGAPRHVGGRVALHPAVLLLVRVRRRLQRTARGPGHLFAARLPALLRLLGLGLVLVPARRGRVRHWVPAGAARASHSLDTLISRTKTRVTASATRVMTQPDMIRRRYGVNA